MKRAQSRKSTASRSATVVEDTPAMPSVKEKVRPSLDQSVSESAIAAINAQDGAEEIASAVAGLFELTRCDADLQQAALLDVYTALYWHTRQQKYPLWLQAYALSMQRGLQQQISDGRSYEQVFDAFKDLALDLARSSQGYGTSKVGMASHTWLEGKCEDLLATIRTGVVQHYELFRYMYTEEQSVVARKCSYRMFTPIPSSADHKHFPPHLDEALELDLWNKARGTVETPTQSSAAQSRRSSKGTEKAEPAAEANATAAGLDDKQTADLEQLLGKLSLNDILSITKSMARTALAEHERKVLSTLAEQQKRLSGTVDAAGKKRT